MTTNRARKTQVRSSLEMSVSHRQPGDLSAGSISAKSRILQDYAIWPRQPASVLPSARSVGIEIVRPQFATLAARSGGEEHASNACRLSRPRAVMRTASSTLLMSSNLRCGASSSPGSHRPVDPRRQGEVTWPAAAPGRVEEDRHSLDDFVGGAWRSPAASTLDRSGGPLPSTH